MRIQTFSFNTTEHNRKMEQNGAILVHFDNIFCPFKLEQQQMNMLKTCFEIELFRRFTTTVQHFSLIIF